MPKDRKLRYSIRLKTITMIFVFTLTFMTIAMAYYSIMIKKINKETYYKVAADISESAALTINVEDVKYLKGIIDPRVHDSKTKPFAEESSQEDLDAYYVQFAGFRAFISINNINNILNIIMSMSVLNIQTINKVVIGFCVII